MGTLTDTAPKLIRNRGLVVDDLSLILGFPLFPGHLL
jgi:hypothetical protein